MNSAQPSAVRNGVALARTLPGPPARAGVGAPRFRAGCAVGENWSPNAWKSGGNPMPTPAPRHQLLLAPESHRLVATLTFSNENYISRVEPRHDETFDFALPGVKLDPRTGVFSVTGSRGQSIPVASLRRESIGISPSCPVPVSKSATSTAASPSISSPAANLPGDRWVERHH